MLRNKAFIVLFITVLLDCIGLRIIYPVSASIITEVSQTSLHEGVTYNGWILSIYAVMQFIFAPVIGGISDRYGRRPVILLSLLGMCLSYLFLMWAHTLPLLFIGRIIAGITGSALTTAFAYTADISDAKERSKLFGYLGAAVGFGFIIGPFIGGFFSQWGSRLPFLVAAILAFINFIFGYIVLAESLDLKQRRPFKIMRSNPLSALIIYMQKKELSGLFIVLFCLFFGAQILPIIWPFYTKLVLNWSDLDIGNSMAFVGLTVALVKLGLIDWSNKHLGENTTIRLGLLFTAIGFLLFTVNRSDILIYLAAFVFALGGLASPTLQAKISLQVPSNEQGELQGVISSLLSLVNIIAPLLVSSLFYVSSEKATFYYPELSFYSGALVSLFGLLFFRYLIQNQTK